MLIFMTPRNYSLLLFFQLKPNGLRSTKQSHSTCRKFKTLFFPNHGYCIAETGCKTDKVGP